MSQTRAQFTEVKMFNPYAGMQPPQCCYCAPIPPAEPDQYRDPVTGEPVFIQVETPLSGGMGDLAFMTAVEDAFRTLEQDRVADANGLKRSGGGIAEMGYGPYSFTVTTPPAGL